MSGKMMQRKKQPNGYSLRPASGAARWQVAAYLRCRSVSLLAAAVTMAFPIAAARAGGPIQVANVAAGTAAFAQAGSVTTITAANNTIINYQKFGIPQGNTVDFIQPSASARVLNRIIGPTPTQIDGTLNANGVVYFVNPAGVMFGDGAVINVGQLYAAAGHMSDADFLSGVNSFTDNSGSITNAGVIKAGDVTFAAGNISNNGTILTPEGMVVMAAGKDVYVSKLGSPFLVQVAGAGNTNAKGATPGVSNSGTIDAAGGDVAIRAGDMYSLAINTSGTIKAANVSIQAAGADSTVLVSGKIDAANQGAGSTGGTITVNGGNIGIGVTADAAGNYNNVPVTLSAQGTHGGGEILIGVQPDAASATGYSDASGYDFIGSSAVLNASATSAGSGGLVDTSGQVLNVSPGAVILAAGAGGGSAGQWLLDPTDVTITGSTSSATTGFWNAATPPHGTFEPLATSSGAYTTAGTADTGTIDAALQAGDNVTITTANGNNNSGTGSIMVNSSIAPAFNSRSATTVSLSLDAANSININSSITSTGTVAPMFNVVLNSGESANNSAVTIAAAIGTATGNGVHSLAINPDSGTGVTGGNINFSTGGTVTTNGGGQTFNGPVILATNTILADSNSGTIAFGGTVDSGTNTGSPFSLEIETAGNTLFSSGAYVGSTNALSSLTIDSVDTAGALDLNMGIPTGRVNNNSVTTDQTALNTPAQTYDAAAITLGQNTMLADIGVADALGSSIIFNGTIDAANPGVQSLTVNTSPNTANLTTFNGFVGSTSALASLTVDNVDTLGTLDLNMGIPTGLVNNSNSITTTTFQTYDSTGGGTATSIGNTLSANTRLASLDGGAITFGPNATVDSGTNTGSPFSLEIETAGNTIFGGGAYVGSTNALLSLTIDAGDTTGALDLNMGIPTGHVNNNSVTTDQTALNTPAQTYDAAAITLGQNTMLADIGVADTLSSSIIFNGTIDAASQGVQSLTVNTSLGTANLTTFNGFVGSTTNLAALNVSGTTSLGGNVTTTGDQTYTGNVTLANGGTPTTFTLLAGTNTVSFGGTVNGATAGADTLDIGNAANVTNATFGGAVGGGISLGSMAVQGTSSLGGNVTTTGDQTYTGNVTLADGGTPTTFTLLAGTNTVGFDGTVNGATAGVADTLDIGNATNVTNATFGGAVGGGISLGSMAVQGTSSLGGNVTTTGGQTYTGAVTLSTPTTLSGTTVNLGGGVTGGNKSLTVTGVGTFGTITGVNALQDTGDAIFNGAISSTTSTNVSGTTSINTASITTTGGQTYTGAVTLGANTNLTDSSSAGILFGATTSGTGKNLAVLENSATGPVAFDGSLPSAGALGNVTVTAGGQITFGPAVTIIAANSFSVDSTNDTAAAAISFSGSTLIAANTQSYTAAAGSLVLAGETFINTGQTGLPTSFTISQGSSITDSSLPLLIHFLSAPGTPAASLAGMGIQLTSTAGSITTSGSEFFGASLSLNGSTGVTLTNTTKLFLNSLAVTGNTTFNGAIVTAQGQTYNSPVTLGNSFTLADDGLGTITFASTISGAKSLGVEASSINFQGNIGYGAGLNPLISLTVGGYSVGGPTSSGTTTLGTVAGGGAVETSGNQTWANAVTLNHAASLVSTGITGSVVFGSTVNGAQALIVEADNTAFQANVGSSTALLSVSAGGYSAGGPAAGGTTTLGGNVTTTAGQTYDNPLTLAIPDVVLSDTGGGNITLTSVSGAGDSLAVTVLGTGAITATGAINTAGSPGSAGGFASPGSAGGTGGNLTLTAVGGSISISNVVTSGGTGGNGGTGNIILPAPGGNGGNGGNAGAVSISSNSGTVTVGSIAADGGAGGTGGFGAPLGVGGTPGANGAIRIAAATGGITLNAGGLALAISGAAETFDGPATLDGDTTIAGSTLNSGAASGLTVSGGNGHSLAMNLTGSGNLGAMAGLSSLAANGGIPYTLNGSIGASGTQSFAGPVILGASGITLTGSTTTFNSTVNSLANAANPLTIGGNAVFSGTVGGAANGQLGQLNISGTTGLGGSVDTGSYAQTYTGTATLNATGITLTGGTVTFNGIDSVDSAANAGNTLAIVGNAALGGVVGGASTGQLGALSVSGTTTLGGNVTTASINGLTGDQTYDGAVTLTANSTLTGVALAGPVTGVSFTGHGTLALNFSSSVNLGAISSLGSLVSNGPGMTTLSGNITTSGAQSYIGTVLLAATPITLTGTTLNSATPAVFSGNSDALTLNFSGGANLGAISTLGSLSSIGSGATILNGDITTSGAQSYNGTVLLAATPITLTGTTLNSATPAVFSGNGDGLTLNFSGGANLGAISTLGSLSSIGSGTTTLNGDITTSGAQSYNGTVLLAATPTTLTGTTLNSATPAEFSGNGDALTLNFSGGANLGAISTLGSLSSIGSGTTTLNGDITTSGAQSYNGTVSLASAAITLTGTTLNSTSTPAVFSGSGGALTLAFSGTADLGTITALGSLADTGLGTTTLYGNITTSGAQSYNGTVSLGSAAIILAGTTLNSSSTPAVFSGSGDALTLNFSGNANLGTIATLGSLANTGLGATTLYGNITTSGFQSYNGTVSLAAGAITLTGTTLNSSSTPAVFSGSGGALTLAFSGTADLGTITALGSLADTGSGTTTLYGNITTSGNQTYSSPTGIASALTLTGTSLNPSPNAAAIFSGAGAPALTLDFSRSYNVNLGASSGLASLDLGVPSTVPFNILTSTTLSYPLTVAGTVTVGQSGDPAGSVITLTGSAFTFKSSFDAASPNDGVVFAALGGTPSNVEFDGVVGGSSANPDLASLTVQGTATVNGGAVNTVNSQIYDGGITINGGGTTTFTSTQGGIAEDGGISDTAGGITLSPDSALMVPNPDPILGAGATTGDFRPQNYLTLNGNIAASGTVTLAPNAPSFNNVNNPVPDAATIITTIQSGTVTVTGTNIYMGMSQKWTSLTSLTLDANVAGGANVAALGDLNVAGTLTVRANTIDMLLRPAGSQLVPGSSSGVLGLHVNTPGSEGVDIVANSLNLTGSIVPVGAVTDYAPQFAYGPGGTVTGSITPNSPGVHYYGVNVVPSTLMASGIADGRLTTYYLGLKASGPSTSNVTVAVAPILPPPPPQFNSVVVLSSEQRQILREAGINARNTSIDNILNLFGGKAVFNDIPTSDGMIIVHPTLLDYYVTTSRLPYQQTKDFIAMYRDLFLAPVIDPKTHQPELDQRGNPIYRSRRMELHVLFRDSYNDYAKAVGAAHATPLGFRTWLEKTPGQTKVLSTLNQLRTLLRQVRQLGLTSVELRLSHSTILAELNPGALSERQFEETVMGHRLSKL